MPTKLPNGLTIYNVTPHELVFMTREGAITAPSDGVVNARSLNRNLIENEVYTLTTVRFVKTLWGQQLIDKIRKECPNAMIVGSIIAAETYPGEVVTSVPLKSNRYEKSQRLLRPDRFTIFQTQQEIHNA